ncbi:hypothetical protein C0V97_01315 [Asaia sp. W19]|uniref:hypothetical protein n=1 Tax=unclassified Asaia TaxID=2685023 RepID=UPI000F8D7431|nr:hypothetical protein [Asaia sp. W19]RUT27436.1 hypothetical protein C0V97_01315 [Asaia sp. W19]
MGLSLLEVENALGAIGQLDRAAPVLLGDMVLSGPEVPDQLIIGGRQLLVIHRLLGGGRVIDSVGNDPARLILTGRFVGPLATTRARRMEAMREAAQVLSFSLADLAARVWIAEFSWSYQARGTICPYRLVLEREALPAVPVPGMADQVDTAMLSGLGTISGLLGEMAEAGWIGTAMITSLTGQIMPVAKSLGVTGAVADAQNALGKASALWQSAMNTARLTSVLDQTGSSLSVAASDLAQARDDAESVLDRTTISSSADLLTMAQNSGLSTLSVEAGSHVTRSRALIGEALTANF